MTTDSLDWLNQVRYVGVDVGNTGAVAFLDKDLTVVRVESFKTGPCAAGALDQAVMFGIIPDGYDFEVFIEDVSSALYSGMGTSATSLFSNAWNMAIATCIFHHYPIYTEGPKTWRRTHQIVGKDKKDSIKAALKFKGASRWVNVQSDHDKAEAILMAAFIPMRRELGKLETIEKRGARLKKGRDQRKAAAKRKKARAAS